MASIIDEQALELTRYIDNQELIKAGKRKEGEAVDPEAAPSQFLRDSTELLAHRKYGDLFDKIFPFGPAIASADELTVTGFYKTLSGLLKFVDAAAVAGYVARLVKHFSAAVDDRAAARLALLTNLYNVLDSASSSRYDAFLAVVDYALASKQTSRVQITVGVVQSWLKEWNATPAQTRTLLERMGKVTESSEDIDVHFDYLKEYLSTFQGAPASEISAVKAAATNAAVVAIKSPRLFQFDSLLALDAVQQLKSESVYALLDVFVSGNYEQYAAFHAKSGATLGSLGLDHEKLTHKIRLLTVTTLARASAQVEYSAIKAALGINADEVEQWVIAAIQAGLIQAKLDQLRELVIVQSATSRHFADNDWQGIKEKVDTWRNNVRQLLTVVHNARVEQTNKLAEVAGER